MNIRGTMALALLVVGIAGLAGETDAAACPAGMRGLKARRAPQQPRSEVVVNASAFEQYNLDRINALRKSAGVPPLVLDGQLTTFAREGTAQLMRDHIPHAHFAQAGNGLWSRGFAGNAAENQGANTGWPRAANDANQNEQQQIDQILASMMREGPGGGHHDSILNPKLKRLGVGLAEDSEGKLYLTNDFSG
jgi:uncharacterized protein YkwD